jgi:hypothetical protein
MANAHETLEHAEHAAHAGHGGKTGTYIGLSMAVLGVLLAFCSALVGAERTELIKTMVEQQNAHSKYQAQNTKHRMVLTQLLTAHSTMVTPAEAAEADAELDALAKKAAAQAAPPPVDAKAPGSPAAPTMPAVAKPAAPAAAAADGNTALLIEGLKIVTRRITDSLAPQKEDVRSLVGLAKKYETERDAAKEWSESFDEAVEAHTESAERYEWGQLAAEVGIVIASIALLMSSKKIWSASLVLGVLAIGIVAHTRMTIHTHLVEAEHKIEEHGKVYRELRKNQSLGDEESALIKSVEAIVGTVSAPKAAPEKGEKPKAGEHGGEHGAEHPHGH